MGLSDRITHKISEQVQPLISEPVVTAANFTWPVTWSTPSYAQSHPELAGGLPEVVIIALTAEEVHLCAPTSISGITHEAKRGSEVVRLGGWPRWMLRVERLDKPTRIFGKEMTTLPTIQLTLPGHDATLHGTQGAHAAFMRELLAIPPAPPLTFGDLVWVTGPDGVPQPGRYLAGPFDDHRGHVIWVSLDEQDYWNAVEREGRDPDGTAFPAEQVTRR